MINTDRDSKTEVYIMIKEIIFKFTLLKQILMIPLQKIEMV